MNDAFAGIGGSALAMLGMTDDMDEINSVLRPYLVQPVEVSER